MELLMNAKEPEEVCWNLGHGSTTFSLPQQSVQIMVFISTPLPTPSWTTYPPHKSADNKIIRERLELNVSSHGLDRFKVTYNKLNRSNLI